MLDMYEKDYMMDVKSKKKVNEESDLNADILKLLNGLDDKTLTDEQKSLKKRISDANFTLKEK